MTARSLVYAVAASAFAAGVLFVSPVLVAVWQAR